MRTPFTEKGNQQSFQLNISVLPISGRAVWGAGLEPSYTGSRVRIPLRAWMFVLVCPWCVVLCR
jgi:hypothetical protein